MGVKKKHLALFPYAALAVLSLCNVVFAAWDVGDEWTVSPDWHLLGANPVAVFTKNATLIEEGGTVNFDASGSYDPDGHIDAWSWDFGDGNTTTGETCTNTFVTAGVYSVVLTVTDNSALTDDTSQDVTVIPVGGSETGFEMGFSSFTVNSQLGFMCDYNQTVLLTVTDGEISSQDVHCTIGRDSGYFSFLALTDSVIHVDVNELTLVVRGDEGYDWRNVGDDQSLTVDAGDTVELKWHMAIVDWLSPFIMPALGLGGMGMAGFGLFFLGQKIRDRDVFESIKAVLVCMVFVLIGAGLVIGWLW